MADSPRGMRHAVGIALLLLGAALLVALVSYDPADPLGASAGPPNAWPANESPSNWCGRLGAVASSGLITNFGLGAYFLVGSLIVLGGRFLRDPISEPALRSLGWILAASALVTLLAVVDAPLSGRMLWGPGGWLGASLADLLTAHVGPIGVYSLLASLIVGGLLLCTDYVILHVAGWVVREPSRHALRVGRAGLQRTADLVRIRPRRGSKAKDDDREFDDELEDEEFEDEPEDRVAAPLPSVKFRQRKMTFPDDAAIDEEETQKSTGLVRAAIDAVTRRNSRPPQAAPVAPSAFASEAELDAGETASEEDLDGFELPDIDVLMRGAESYSPEHEKLVRRNARLLEKSFASFGFNVRVVEIETGPVISQYELELEAGLRVSKVAALADDLAIALRVPTVRIVAPIPGKNTVGVEAPNQVRQLVRIREVIEESEQQTRSMRLPLFLGKDVSGNPMTVDLATLPHLLIAGRTGTGKSVCLNSLIISLLMTRRPDEVRMLMIDPKMVELSPYKSLPHLMHPVVTDMRKAEAILGWAVDKMEERYSLLARAGVRHMSVYNQLGEEELRERMAPESEEEWEAIPKHLPYIVIVADEMADLMMTAAKEVETHIIRLAQKSRAVGIHLVLATQKPTVDVITGLIKSNLPARIAFQVASRTDSRVVLDEGGADKLLGNGDMLFLWPGTSTLLRGQGAFVSDDEINGVIEAVGADRPCYNPELMQLEISGDAAGGEAGGTAGRLKNRDELYLSAVETVIREGRGSVSLLQRALGVGYGRAARLIDFMEEDGVVGPYAGSQAREVLISFEQWQAMLGDDGAAGPDAAPTPPWQSTAKPHDEAAADEEWEEEDEEDEEYEAEDEDEEVAALGDAENDFEEDEEAEDEEEYETDEYEDEEYEEEEEEVEETPPPRSRLRRPSRRKPTARGVDLHPL